MAVLIIGSPTAVTIIPIATTIMTSSSENPACPLERAANLGIITYSVKGMLKK
jgi:hypothetical protein